MSRKCAYSEFAHLKDNQLLNFVLSLGNDGNNGDKKGGKKEAVVDKKKMAKLQNIRDENGEKISNAQKQMIIKMISKLEEMQETAFAERADLTDRIGKLTKKLADVQEKVNYVDRENQVGESLGQSLRSEIEQSTEMQQKYQKQCDEFLRESEEIRHTQIMNLDVKLHKMRQEAREAERELKLAVWASSGSNGVGVGADTPLPPLPLLQPALNINPPDMKRPPRLGDTAPVAKYKALVNQDLKDLMEVDHSYSHSWAKRPGGSHGLNGTSFFDDEKSFGTLTTRGSMKSPTSKASTAGTSRRTKK